MLTPNFGATLKQHRTANGLSIRKLASISGIAKSYIDYLEHGQRLPSAKTIKTLANTLNVPRQSLLDGLMVDYQQALKEENNEAISCNYTEKS